MVMQVYAPTSDVKEEEVDMSYDQIQCVREHANNRVECQSLKQ